MDNPNRILKTVYYTSITAVKPTGTEVFKNYVPNQLETDNYYLISNVQNVDLSNKCKHRERVFVTITIYTKTSRENSAVICDDMADALFSLYPTPLDYPTVEGYQVYDVSKESDNELSVTLDSGEVLFTRQIIFAHTLNKLN